MSTGNSSVFLQIHNIVKYVGCDGDNYNDCCLLGCGPVLCGK
jgi:hypothetical protein